MADVRCIRNLKDVEEIIQEGAMSTYALRLTTYDVRRTTDNFVMSGDTSSPADGGHLRRGLPPSAALRWNHYHFVSPLHQKMSTYDVRLTTYDLKKVRFFLVLLVLVVNGIVAGDGYAEFSYQNPARSGLEEIRSQSPRQLQTSSSQQRELVKKQQAIAETTQIQKEMENSSEQIKKSLEDEKGRRQNAERNTTELSKKATEQTERVRGGTEVGFEYSLEENFDGSVAKVLLLEGLVARVEGEAVKNDFGTVSKQNRDITYYGWGKYYRLPRSERVELITNTGEKVIVEVSETTFEEYHGDPKWWANKYSQHYAFPKAYTAVSSSSLTPYKIDTIKVTQANPHINLEDGQWQRDSWIEETNSTDEPGVIYRRQVFMASYDDYNNLSTFFSISWSPKADLELVLTTYKGTYTKLPDGREKVGLEEVKRTEIPATSDPKLMAILDSVLAEELVPFELVQYAYGIAIE